MSSINSTPLASLLSNAQQRKYPKGQIVLYQGDVSQHMFILKTGQIKMYDIDDQGNEKIVHILRPPSIFPFSSYLGKSREVMWFYAALSDIETYVLSREEIYPMMQKDPELTYYMLEHAVIDMHELFVRLSSMSKTTTQRKLIAAMKFLGTHHSRSRQNGWRRVDFSVNHQLLADMTGITRESATLAMQQLQKERLVRSPHVGILDINFDKLTRYEA